jgi:hypothetical protein
VVNRIFLENSCNCLQASQFLKVKRPKIQKNIAKGNILVRDRENMEVTVLPVEDRLPRPESGQGGNALTSNGSHLIDIYEVANRLQLPVREVSRLVAGGHLHYFLFSFGALRFSWQMVLNDLSKVEHTGNPQELVEAEIAAYQSPSDLELELANA